MAKGFITRRCGGNSGTATTNIITITSETELPSSPKDGTIAILTNTPVGKIYAQTATPESPSVGDLWFIPSGTANVVYISEKEAYGVKTVKQYNGTTWEAVNAFQYSEGVWSTLVYLLNGSDECEAFTGGWKAIAIRRADDWTTSEMQAPTVTKIEGGITLTQSASGYKSGAYHTTNKIDVSKYDVLRIQGDMNIKCYGQVRLVSAIGTYSESNTVLVKELPGSGIIDLMLDVSTLDGDYYILFDIATNGNSSTIFTLTKIWMYKSLYLFNSGDQFTALTGGWEQNSSTKIYSVSNNGIVNFNSDNIYLAGGADVNHATIITTVKKIDITNFKTLYFELTVDGNTGNDAYGLITSITSDIATEAVVMTETTVTGLVTLSVDITSLSGEFYVAAGSCAGQGSRPRTIHRIWLV